MNYFELPKWLKKVRDDARLDLRKVRDEIEKNENVLKQIRQQISQLQQNSEIESEIESIVKVIQLQVNYLKVECILIH